jgi:hypothetical protein
LSFIALFASIPYLYLLAILAHSFSIRAMVVCGCGGSCSSKFGVNVEVRGEDVVRGTLGG